MTTRRANHEGSTPFQRKSDGRWQIAIRYIDEDGTAKRVTVTGKTAKEARAKAKEVRDRLAKRLPPKDAKITVGQFAQQWIGSTLDVSDRKDSTKRLYQTLATKHIIGDRLGAVALDRLTPRRVEAWVGDLRRAGLADSSIRSTYTVLRAILDTAVRDRAIGENPAAVVRRPKVRHAEAAYLTPDQVRALLAAAEGSRYHALFMLMANTGLRRGEALALRWSDIDGDVIRVRGTLARTETGLEVTAPKTAKSRRAVPISPAVSAVLAEVRQRQRVERLAAGSQWRHTGFVFTTELGEACDPRNALRSLKAAAKKAQLPPTVGLHTLRHSAASVMLSNGVPLKVVSDLLGHSSVAITGDTYGHVAPDVASEAVAALGKALA